MRHEDAGSLLLLDEALYGSLVGHTLDERASFEAVAPPGTPPALLALADAAFANHVAPIPPPGA